MVPLETNRFTLQFLLLAGFCLCLNCVLLAKSSAKIAQLFQQELRNDDEAEPSSLGLHECNKPLVTMLYVVMAAIAIAFAALAFSFFSLAFLPISRHHSMPSAFFHFCMLIFLRIFGTYYLWKADRATKQPMARQESLLLKQILWFNANTEYGKKWQFKQFTSIRDFVTRHPLTTYETYRPYVERIVKGEQKLLTEDLVEKFNVSSGTTGKCKLLPCPTGAYSWLCRNFFLPYFYLLLKLKREPSFAPIKSAVMVLTPRWRYTESGVPIGPASGTTVKQRRLWMSLWRTLPFEAEVYMNESAQLYLHWLFALYDRDIARIDGTFAGAMLTALELLCGIWEKLAADIRHGRITFQDIPADLIKQLQSDEFIWPDPKRADEIIHAFSTGSEGVVSRLWPRITIVPICTTGAHAIYVPRLRRYFGPTVQFYSPIFGASEGIFGLNMDPSNSEQLYTLQPHLTFMEFIPEDDITKPNPKTLLMNELIAGRRYELVITSVSGFYRYRMGDLIQVLGFRYDVTPIVQFCSRVGSILDLRGEKTSEDMVYTALTNTFSSFGSSVKLIEFTTTECVTLTSVISKHHPLLQNEPAQGLYYVIFVELEGLSRQLTPAEITRFDTELCEVSYPFKSFRARGSIGLSKIFVVARGTFQCIKEHTLLKNGAVSNQYKTPKYVSNAEIVQLLISAVQH